MDRENISKEINTTPNTVSPPSQVLRTLVISYFNALEVPEAIYINTSVVKNQVELFQLAVLRHGVRYRLLKGVES